MVEKAFLFLIVEIIQVYLKKCTEKKLLLDIGARNSQYNTQKICSGDFDCFTPAYSTNKVYSIAFDMSMTASV